MKFDPTTGEQIVIIDGEEITVTASISGFAPGGTYAALAVTSTTGEVALPAGTVVVVFNTGATQAFFNLGTSGSVTATTSDIPLPAGSWMGVTVGLNTNLAAITASSTTTLTLVGGSGLPAGAVAGAGGGVSSTVTLAAGGNLIGTVDINTGQAVGLAAGTANIGTVAVAGGGASTVTLAAGAANVGTVEMGAGTANIGTIDIAAGQTVTSVGTISAVGTLSVLQVASVWNDNVAQVNGVTALTGAGATGTGSQRVTAAQDTSTIAGSAPGTAGTASSQVVSVQGIASGTPLAENQTQINGVALLAGAGATGTGSQRVTTAQDTATIAGSAPGTAGTPSTNVISVQGVASGTAQPISGSVSAALGTTNGWTPLRANALTNTAVAIKGSAGQLGMLLVDNPNATRVFVQVFNVASGSVTVGTTAPTLSIGLEPTTIGGFGLSNPGINFSTAMSIAVTTTATGGTAPATACDANIAYN